MTNYFKNIQLNSIESWGQIFQEIDLFRPIIESIFNKENLPLASITNLTPGSNAVFRVGDYVIKIYVPAQVIDLYGDFKTELNAMIAAEKSGVKLPRVIAQGYYEDLYEFPFIIMEYVKGDEAGKALLELNPLQQQRFIDDLNHLLACLNVTMPFDGPFIASDNSPANNRWDIFSAQVKEEVSAIRKTLDLRSQVLVHGDLTGENVLVDGGKLLVIDFGDARLGPAYYEYGPIAFDLLGWDPELVHMFAEGKEDFWENLFKSLILHEFGAFILRDICKSELGIEPEDLTHIETVKTLIKAMAGKDD